MKRIMLVYLAASVSALAAEPMARAAEAGGQDALPPRDDQEFQAGYDKVPQFGGPNSVSGQLADEDQDKASLYHPETRRHPMQSWSDWKAELVEKHGLALGVFISVLGQTASDSTNDDHAGLGGIYRLQGSWTALGRGGHRPGRIEWRLENRSAIGGMPSPAELGGALGAAALNSGFGYSNSFDTDLSVLNWTQLFRDGTAGFAVGRLGFDAYLDSFAFQTFSRGFLNGGFLVNPTMGTTGIGALGLVAKGFLSDSLWLGGHIYDGNAVNGEFDLDTVREHEYLKAVEIGWTPSFARRKLDRVQLAYWAKDAREALEVPDGSGWVVSASWQVTERWLPFVRFGHSDGGAGVAAESAASGGFEYTLRPEQLLSVGAGWARPSEKTHGPGLDDEYVVEISYQLQLARNLSLLPDVQYILHPANNPDQDRVWVPGLRAILTL